MAYQSYAEKEADVQERRAKLQAHLEPFSIPTPKPFPEENGDQYEERVLPLLQKQTPGFKDLKVSDSFGSARKLIVNQIYEAAEREARAPTNIPEGELRQVIRYDATGRPFYEFYGKCNSWMRQFMPDRIARVAKIRNVDEERGRFTKL
jgi:hypothetical protein